MADDVDVTAERMEFDSKIDILIIQQAASRIEKGTPGDCDLCGETYARLVTTYKDDEEVLACGRCRDKHGLR